MINRANLMVIYSRLTNDEKNLWARNCGRDGYSYVYNYLYRSPNGKVNDKILNALKQTLGEDRYNQFISPFIIASLADSSQFSNSNSNNLPELLTRVKSAALNQISSCNDMNMLVDLKNLLKVSLDITNNQINILELYGMLT